MNYAERIAAGWKPKWGLYNDTTGMWYTSNACWVTHPTVRYGKDLDDAVVDAVKIGGDVRPRRYWVKPKAKPATKSLGKIAQAVYFEFYSDSDPSPMWEKAAQAVASELVRRMRAVGLNGSADVLDKLAKETS